MQFDKANFMVPWCDVSNTQLSTVIQIADRDAVNFLYGRHCRDLKFNSVLISESPY